MIVQHNPGKPNEAIDIDQTTSSRLVIAAFPFPGGECAGGRIDLTPFQGGPFRLYLETDGSLNTELFRDHYWLLAEAVLPERHFENQPTGMTDEHGQPVMTMVEQPLDLNDVEIMVYPLPEVI
ncbi:MAG: hypothetical protein RDV00_03950 [Clostridia bacterium]|nr:hypothetical protein [Clostridia bacterium]